MIGRRFEVWVWAEHLGINKSIDRDNSKRRASRTADRNDGYVTDREHADRVVYVSRGFRELAGLSDGAFVAYPGAKVTPWWLEEGADTDETVAAEW